MLFLFFLPGALQAQDKVNPSIQWKQVKDPYATWVYDSRHKKLVDHYRQLFQQARPKLEALFKELPETTTFMISDHTDLANGSATVFPYPIIRLFPVIPLPPSSISETNNNFLDLITHEYTHILNLHPVHGPLSWLTPLFGSVVRPNALLPRWYVEGLAVYLESELNPQGGRLRSQSFESMVRNLSLHQGWKELSIDQLNDGQPDWIGGQRPYLLGGALIQHLYQSDAEKIYSMNQSYSRRLPYLIEGPLKDRGHEGYEELLTKTYNQLDQQARRQLSQLQTKPATVGQAWPGQGYNSMRLRVSPEGKKAALFTVSATEPPQLLLRNFKTKRVTQVDQAQFFGDSCWITEDRLIFTKIALVPDLYARFAQAYVLDLNSRRITRLPQTQRAAELACATGKNHIYFSKNTPGGRDVYRYDLTNKRPHLLHQSKTVGTQLWSLSANSQRLVFLERAPTTTQVFNYSLEKPERLTTPLTISNKVQNLRVTQDDNVIFTSRANGVDNLYMSSNLNGLAQARPLTNSLTRVLEGELDPKSQTLHYVELNKKGHQALSVALPTYDSLPQISPLLQLNGFQFEDLTSKEFDLLSSKEEPLNPWPYMVPRHLLPFGFVLDGGAGFSLSTSASDPVGQHSYAASALWDTLTKKTGGTLAYTNRHFDIDFTLQGFNLFRFDPAADVTLKDAGGSLSLQGPVPGLSANWLWGTQWLYSATELGNGDVTRTGPSLFLNYNNTLRTGSHISPFKGGRAALVHQSFLDSLGGDVNYNRTNLNLQYFFSGYLPKRHVLSTQLNSTFAPDLKDLTVNGGLASAFYTTTIGGNVPANALIQPFLMRGYTSGKFLGYNMISSNLEYRFPLSDIFWGVNTWPVFLRQLHGSLVADAITLDGFRWSEEFNGFRPTGLEDVFLGGGAEFHLDITVGYHLPLRFTLGFYYGAEKDIDNNELRTFFAFNL